MAFSGVVFLAFKRLKANHTNKFMNTIFMHFSG